MRIGTVLLSAVMALLALVGCAPKSSPVVTSGETNEGTPIVDKSESSFSVSDVSMTSTPDSSCFSEIGYSTSIVFSL